MQSRLQAASIAQWIVALALALLVAADCHAQTLPSSLPSTALGGYQAQLLRLQQQADWTRLEELSRLTMQALTKQFGPDSPEAAEAAQWLAESLLQLARYGEAETLLRHALTVQEKMQGPQHPRTASSLFLLSAVLLWEGRYAEAEPLARRALAIREQAFGPDNVSTAIAIDNLAGLLRLQGHYGEAEPLARRALAINERQWGAQSPETAEGLLRLEAILMEQSHFNEAESLTRRALAIDEQALGAENSRTARCADYLARVLQAEGRYSDAEVLARRALAIRERALGPDHPDTLASAVLVANLLDSQGGNAEAEPLLRRALATDQKKLGADNPQVASDAHALAVVLRGQHRYDEAETLERQALAITERAFGPEHPLVSSPLSSLGTLLSAAGRNSEAEPLLRRALALAEKSPGPNGLETALPLTDLAALLDSEGRYSEAQPLVLRAMVAAEKTLGPDHPNTAVVLAKVAENAINQGHFADAVGALRRACATRSTLNRSRGQSAAAATAARMAATDCAARLALSLWLYAHQGGGLPVARNGPEAIKLEAFAVSQQALQSAAGDALARSAALTAARAADVGPQAEAYEAALLARDGLDEKFAKAASGSTAADAAKREALAKARSEANVNIEQLAAELKSKAPLYWDYRVPEPLSVAALQSKSGPDAAFLHEDEALILFVAVTRKAMGLVFAITKEQAAWAQMGLSGDEIRARVIRLRAEIDPQGYKLQSTAGQAGAGSGANSGAFERQQAYELYQALLGDASIQAVIRDKPVLLIVPSGALTTLPPALLVSAAPPGGANGDLDPESLRATAWLLRSKAVALLPAVSSLRTLRQILPASGSGAADPLLVFADPDFTRPQVMPQKQLASAAARGFSSYFRDGAPLAEALDYLPSLPGTRIEGEALEKALGGRPGSMLTGRDASKAQLLARNADGRLLQVRVLEFATHGLVAGDASDLYEPALALAAGARPQDELLLASEASTLKLHADWVLLSACNTASPDAPEAQGLSGLSRAFFYAGAKSLLVSHWRVRDDVAPKLIPAMLLAERAHADVGRAEALRRASLAILDDRSIEAAEPSAWAPFTLIGEAAR